MAKNTGGASPGGGKYGGDYNKTTPDNNQLGGTGATQDGQTLLEVPFGSYDPSIQAQLLASQRGLQDLRDDTKTAGHWAKTDLHTKLSDIGRKKTRAVQDIRRSAGRERLKLNLQTQDLNRDAGRNRQDFASKLTSINRSYGNLANRQLQSQSASGVLEGGTAQAAAMKRVQNQALDVAPVTTAANRMEQDLSTRLGRIGITKGQLGADTSRSLGRLGTDTRINTSLTKQDFGRNQFDQGRKLQRGIREQKLGEVDLLNQKIYSARQNNPGVFSKYGKKKNGKKVRF